MEKARPLSTSISANQICEFGHSSQSLWDIISNYWMRLSRIWGILQIKEGVIHRGRRLRWITPSEICRIPHILQKPNSIICFIIHSKYFPVLKRVSPFRSLFFCLPKITQSHLQVFSVDSSIICNRLHFWPHFDVIGSVICSGLHFWRHWFNTMKILSKSGEQQLVVVNYACCFNQSETRKYFEWTIINI